MNSILTSKLKPLLPTLPVPRGIDLSEPHLDSARQVSLDLDPAGYGEGSVSDLVHWFIHRRIGVADCRGTPFARDRVSR